MLHKLSTLTLVLCTAVAAQAASVTLNFEGFADSTNLTTQYSNQGATFSNAIILTSGVSLNEFEFPPHSGVNVVSDNGGPIGVAFSTPVTSVSGYFTYAEPLTIYSYNASNTLIGTATSKYPDNEAISGNAGSSPNELLQLTSSSGISSIKILGDSAGGSFALDDLSFSTLSVPEIDASSGFSAFSLLISVLLIFRDRRRATLP